MYGVHSNVIFKVGGLEHLITVEKGLNDKNDTVVKIFVDNSLYGSNIITSPTEERIEAYINEKRDYIKTELEIYTPHDRLMFFVENGMTHSLAITYKKKANSNQVQIDFYYDYQNISHAVFIFTGRLADTRIECEQFAFNRLESIRLNYIRNPERYYEIYNIGGFSFEIGIKFDRMSNGEDYNTLHLLDNQPIGNGRIKNELLHGIKAIIDEIKVNLTKLCPKDVDEILTVGDNIKVKVNIKFYKKPGNSPVKITASLDNMIYNVSTTTHFSYFNGNNTMVEAKRNMIEDIKGFLDTFPKSGKEVYEVRDCKYIVGRDISKEANSNILKMQMTLDGEKYGNLKEYKYDIGNLNSIWESMVSEGRTLYNKLKTDTPNDIISEYNKNDMDFTIHAHFYKKPGDSDIKIEYRIENNKK